MANTIFATGATLSYAASESVVVTVPNGYAYDGTRTCIIIITGAGDPGSITAIPTSATFASTYAIAGIAGKAMGPLAQYLADVGGYPSITIDAARLGLGGQDAMTAIAAAITWSQNPAAAYPAPRGKAGRVPIVGWSRGGLDAYNYLARNQTALSGIVCIAGAMDVDDIYDNNRGGFAPYFDCAYSVGVTCRGDYSATITYNNNDGVVSGGVPYKSTATQTGVAPPSANWTALSTGGGGAWKSNGSNASPSWNPHKNLANLNGLNPQPPIYLWASRNDAVCALATQQYIDLQVANSTLLMLPNDPSHGLAMSQLPLDVVLSQIRGMAPS